MNGTKWLNWVEETFPTICTCKKDKVFERISELYNVGMQEKHIKSTIEKEFKYLIKVG